ncbi:hypothetical protein [Bradyrhizobium sp. NC92]|uniref:hypothetical protein n=1 Tax=Bradyrhizobium sp. (strain NC92) TaxID=55395 RepID=UPI0021AA2415|nr:hypothetical protein [Bradyrhizobium sp. NC92]UWU68207.1 hypothetical protein N2602_34785 [Bradyrhizobium sp. NC92]
MPKFIITYDLMKGKDYDKIIKELEKHGGHKALLSMWFIDLDNTAVDVFDHFIKFVDSDDRLVVTEFKPANSKAKAIKGTNDWLAAHR